MKGDCGLTFVDVLASEPKMSFVKVNLSEIVEPADQLSSEGRRRCSRADST